MEDLYTHQKLESSNPAFSFLDRIAFDELLLKNVNYHCTADLNRLVFDPLQKFTNSSSRQFRARLVELSISLSSNNSSMGRVYEKKGIGQKLAQILEALHAGSLIIDDIQDGAATRRGKPCLHNEVGVPQAINSGSWLYFWALSLISQMELPPSAELEVNRLCHQTMMKGHLGQALDLGVRIDEVSQAKVKELSSSTMKLKTGMLMSLASEIGPAACGANAEVREAFKNFGIDFGYALQCFNDLGEYSIKNQKISQDLILGRPSWIWVCASESLSASDYLGFINTVHELRAANPSSQINIMNEIKQLPLVQLARSEAKKLMALNYQKLSDQLIKFDSELTQKSDWSELKLLGQKVMDTYD